MPPRGDFLSRAVCLRGAGMGTSVLPAQAVHVTATPADADG
jgi:hypothetical protein